MTAKIGEFEVDVTVKRVKNLRLRIDRTGKIAMTLPHGYPIERAEAFVLSRGAWIKSHLSKLAQKHPTDVYDGATVWFLGKPCRVEFKIGSRTKVEKSDVGIMVTAPEKSLVRVAENYFKSEFFDFLATKIKWFEAMTGLKQTGFCVKKMRSKWGSCAIRTNALTFSYYLAFKPESAIEYVVLHELAHTVVHAHDARFYALISRYMPDWKARKRLLNQF